MKDEVIEELEQLAKCVKKGDVEKMKDEFENVIQRTFSRFHGDLDVLTSCCRAVRNACARSSLLRNVCAEMEFPCRLIRMIRHAIEESGKELALLVAIQTLGNCITKKSRSLIWKEMFRPDKENKILFCRLCCDVKWNNTKALTRLSMILYLLIRRDDENSHSMMKTFVQDRKLVHTWLHTFRSDTDKTNVDMVEWVLLVVHDMISKESIVSEMILGRTNDELALFLNLLVVATTTTTTTTTSEESTCLLLNPCDAQSIAELLITLLKRLKEEKEEDCALYSAASAAMEICADLSSKMRSTFQSPDLVAVRIRETLLGANAVSILVKDILEPFSPGRRKARLTTHSITKIHPGIRDQLLNNAMRLLANCSFQNENWQNRVREANGIESVLSCTTINEKNPILREWALLAVRNLCDGNRSNQRRIEKLKPRKVLQDPTLKRAGYQIRFDEATGKPKIEMEPDAVVESTSGSSVGMEKDEPSG